MRTVDFLFSWESIRTAVRAGTRVGTAADRGMVDVVSDSAATVYVMTASMALRRIL